MAMMFDLIYHLDMKIDLQVSKTVIPISTNSKKEKSIPDEIS